MGPYCELNSPFTNTLKIVTFFFIHFGRFYIYNFDSSSIRFLSFVRLPSSNLKSSLVELQSEQTQKTETKHASAECATQPFPSLTLERAALWSMDLRKLRSVVSQNAIFPRPNVTNGSAALAVFRVAIGLFSVRHDARTNFHRYAEILTFIFTVVQTILLYIV